MNVTIDEIAAWVIIGMLAGSLAGLVLKRKKEGYGRFANLGIGLVGAIIGGFLFDILGIDLGKANITITLRDIVAAFVGSLIFLAILFYVRRQMDIKKSPTPTN